MFRSQLNLGLRWIILATALACSSLGSTTTRAEQSVGSANYMLPLCKTWLKIAVERDKEEIANILKTDPARLTSSGMCAGMVIGILETLRVVQLSCPPDGLTNEQLVRMVVDQIEKHPENLHEDFIVPASAVMIATWSCKPKK
jgi:hypothetical protein